ncbi:hypothetical protein Nepgr_016421 [Nepenthes gracilis]|uniref:Uncharacterized protein n=1 Tax=Nepenthes gracilis TaxID=150966 RepID=A0AAD3XSH2_NEPGR|nr:hypothetical protein Nepgr_016421 [Nepenthes gracilis]
MVTAGIECGTGSRCNLWVNGCGSQEMSLCPLITLADAETGALPQVPSNLMQPAMLSGGDDVEEDVICCDNRIGVLFVSVCSYLCAMYGMEMPLDV